MVTYYLQLCILTYIRLKGLTLEQKIETFSVQNTWLTTSLIQMYKKWANCDDIVFAMFDNKKPM